VSSASAFRRVSAERLAWLLLDHRLGDVLSTGAQVPPNALKFQARGKSAPQTSQ
jgi:hypothetical protein